MNPSTSNLPHDAETSTAFPPSGSSLASSTHGVHQAITKIRPPLTRNQSSFSRAVSSVAADTTFNLNLPRNLASGHLDTPTKDVMKDDINLVKEVGSETVPLTVPKIQTPLLTPQPIPNTKAAFIEAVEYECKKIVWTKAGLKKYLEVIHSEEHTVFSQDFLDSQIATCTAAMEELDEIKPMLDEIKLEASEMDTPAQTPAQTPQNVAMDDYFATLSVKDEVKEELKEKFAALKPLIHRIRGIVVGAHVFYKINYALAADKKKEEK